MVSLVLNPDDLHIGLLLLYSLGGCGLIVLMEKIRFNLPDYISTVPITMHTFAINLLPLLFGWKIATLSSLLYYAHIGYHNIKDLYHATGGYLIGFIIASLQIGSMIENHPKSNNVHIIALIIGNFTILFAGMLFMPIGLSYKTGKSVNEFSDKDFLLRQAVVPFIPGAIIKIILAICIRSYVILPLLN